MARVDDVLGDVLGDADVVRLRVGGAGEGLTVLVASGDGDGDGDEGGVAVELRVLVELPAVGVGAAGALLIALLVAVVLCVVGVAFGDVAFGDAEAGWLLAPGVAVPSAGLVEAGLVDAGPAGAVDAPAVGAGSACGGDDAALLRAGVGAGVVGNAPGGAVASRTGSHDLLLPAEAELAALAWLARVARLNSETAVSRTPPASRVTAAGRGCAKRMNALPVLLDAVSGTTTSVATRHYWTSGATGRYRCLTRLAALITVRWPVFTLGPRPSRGTQEAGEAIGELADTRSSVYSARGALSTERHSSGAAQLAGGRK